MQNQSTNVRPTVQYATPSQPSISVWGVVGGAIGNTFGWLLKTVAPAVVAGAAGGYAVHYYYDKYEEDTTDDVK